MAAIVGVRSSLERAIRLLGTARGTPAAGRLLAHALSVLQILHSWDPAPTSLADATDLLARAQTALAASSRGATVELISKSDGALAAYVALINPGVAG